MLAWEFRQSWAALKLHDSMLGIVDGKRSKTTIAIATSWIESLLKIGYRPALNQTSAEADSP